MSHESVPGRGNPDRVVIDLLRDRSRLGIRDLASALGVTATAVRQRIDRLIRDGFVERQATEAAEPGRPRGRPAHTFALTERGRRLGGDNFRELAMVLWREIRSVREPAVRQGLLGRIGLALADRHRGEIAGDTPGQRLASVAAAMSRRGIACSTHEITHGSARGDLAVLTTHTCPYPDLAEEDRAVCAAERLMLQDLVGAPVTLSECRLDGGGCCRFSAVTPGPEPQASPGD